MPDILFKTPEYSIINYFSILREAANPEKGKFAGCGTLGQAKLPYPVAYDFLSADYQKKLSYEQYLKTFENILHINLLKLIEVPVYGGIWGLMLINRGTVPDSTGVFYKKNLLQQARPAYG